MFTHQIDLLHWLKSCSSFEVNSGSFLSARLLPETLAAMNRLSSHFVYVGRSHVRTSQWIFTYEGCEKFIVGGITLEIISLDRKDWRSCWFQTDYFITEYFFNMTSFKSRHVTLSIDNLSCLCPEYSLSFSSFWRRQRRQSAPFILFLFYKITKLCF